MITKAGYYVCRRDTNEPIAGPFPYREDAQDEWREYEDRAELQVVSRCQVVKADVETLTRRLNKIRREVAEIWYTFESEADESTRWVVREVAETLKEDWERGVARLMDRAPYLGIYFADGNALAVKDK
jgi:hypothetical protein